VGWLHLEKEKKTADIPIGVRGGKKKKKRRKNKGKSSTVYCSPSPLALSLHLDVYSERREGHLY